MKIAEIELIPVTLPYGVPVSDAWGQYTEAKCGIVRIMDEAGLEGFGEVSLAWFGGVHHMLREAAESWVPHLIGMDTEDITGISQTLDAFTCFSKRHLLVKAGIEMAVWDLLGKERNLPVYMMLGGARRDHIRLTAGIGMLEIDVMKAQAEEAIAAGFRELKIKIGLEEKKDLTAVKAVREIAGDDIAIRVDANMAWKDRKQALYMMEALWDLGVKLVEQPMDYRDTESHKWLRDRVHASILIDEGIWDSSDLVRYIRADAVDIPHVYICEAGGIEESRKIFEIAETFGLDCTIGSMPEGLVGACAAAQVAAAMPNLSEHASDLRGFIAFQEDVAFTKMHIENGYLMLPEGNGLGFEIDREKLEHLRTDR